MRKARPEALPERALLLKFRRFPKAAHAALRGSRPKHAERESSDLRPQHEERVADAEVRVGLDHLQTRRLKDFEEVGFKEEARVAVREHREVERARGETQGGGVVALAVV